MQSFKFYSFTNLYIADALAKILESQLESLRATNAGRNSSRHEQSRYSQQRLVTISELHIKQVVTRMLFPKTVDFANAYNFASSLAGLQFICIVRKLCVYIL